MLNHKKLILLIVIAISMLLLQSSVLAQPTEDWVNTPITQQTGVFTAEFNAKATADSVDAVLGLSNKEPTDYPDLNVLIQFNNEGFILVKNGDTYESLTDLSYEADMSFAFRQLVDIPAQTHSLWVIPEGGDEVLLAEDYAFAVATDTINYRSVKMSFHPTWGGNVGMIEVSGFIIKTPPTEDFVITPVAQQTGTFMAEFNAKATADSVDGVLGLSKAVPTDYGDINVPILFENTGLIKVKNGADYESLTDLTYAADQMFAFKHLVNIPAQTHSVWVTPEGGDEVLLAEDYAFAVATDTLNYRSVKMSFDAQWGGNEGMVEVTDFITKTPVTDEFVITPIAQQTDAFIAEFKAKATADNVDGVLGLSKAVPTDYGDINVPILFENTGLIKVKNGSSYESLTDLTYAADQMFAFKHLVDIPAQTHSVWVTPEGGEEVLLAEDYAFAVATDTLNYRSIKMSFDAQWGGNEGTIEVADFTITPHQSAITEDFVITPIDQQTGTFIANFNAKATADSVDGVLGLSKAVPTDYGDINVPILFENTGLIKVKNGSSYESLTDLTYAAGQMFAFKHLVNIPAQTHSVWVTPEGGEEVLLAEDYAFAVATDTLNYRSVKMSFDAQWGGNEGIVKVTDFKITIPPTDEFVITPIAQQTGAFMAEFNAKATADSVDGVLGLSKAVPTDYGDINVPILFENTGLIKVKNGADYESLTDLTYAADQMFAFKHLVNIPAQTQSVWVTPEGGDEVLLAEDYAFAVATDTLNYRSVKMSFDPQWGGNEGMVEITDFTITELDLRKKCLFITHSDEEKQQRDSTLVEHLEKSYNVTFMAHDIFSNSGLFTAEQLNEYDFLFISETAGTFHLATASSNMNLRAMPIPTVFTEGYATKLEVFGWTTLPADTGFGAVTDSALLNNSDKIIITDAHPGHDLAAGFEVWEELAIISQAGSDHGTVTFTKPTITEYIEIAWSSADPIEKTIVMGLEIGSNVWNEAGDMDNVATENRSSFIGVAGPANNYINENGFKLIDAGIAWVLDEGVSAIGDEYSAMPSRYSLAQNYPNPFNPTTTIAFNLAKSGHTTLTVYNLLGQKVVTLLDKEMVSGAHQVTFEQKNLATGVYFYQLKSGDFTEIKKMVLMK